MDNVIANLSKPDGKVTLKDHQEVINEFQTQIANGLEPNSEEGLVMYAKFFLWSLLDKEITGKEPIDIVKKILEPKDES